MPRKEFDEIGVLGQHHGISRSRGVEDHRVFRFAQPKLPDRDGVYSER